MLVEKITALSLLKDAVYLLIIKYCRKKAFSAFFDMLANFVLK